MPLVQQIDPLLSPFFKAVSFPEDRVAELKNLAREGTLVYVMRSAGALNYAYFAHAYKRRGLPVPKLVQGMGDSVVALASGVRDSGVEAVAKGIDRGESALLFLRRPEVFGPRHGTAVEADPFAELVKLARDRDRRIFLVPQILVWERNPGKLRPGLASAFMGTPDSPNPWRTAAAFLYNFRQAFAKVGTPIDLHKFCREQPQGTSAELIARKVRGALWQHLAHETRVVTGPQLKEPERVVEEVMRDRVLQQTLEQLSTAGQGTREELTRNAEECLKEIAAAYSPLTIEFLTHALEVVFNRIYDGIEIDAQGLERIRRAAAHSPIVLCPSHKSHIDYLILSKVLYDAGMVAPHVAAGANLSFFPLGTIFRSAGAYFLRRSFKGDKVYGATFRAYVKRLMRDQFPQEFFIEGGRSRSGKLLSPKLGLLSMLVDAWLEGASHDVSFIPVAIDYGRIVEGGSYAKEAAGGEKKKESIRGLLGAPKVLTTRYGRIYLQVEEPVSIKEFYEERGFDPKHHTEAQRRELVQVLAHRIIYGIARAATVTPAALVAATALSHRQRGLPRSEVEQRIAFLRKLCERTGARLSRVLYEASSDPGIEGPIREATLLLGKEGCLEELPASGETYLIAKAERRLQLAFYKNNLLHPLVPVSLLASALFSFRDGPPTIAALRERTLWLSRLFKHEFVYRVGVSFTQIFDETFELCCQLGLIDPAKVSNLSATVQPSSISGRERLEMLRDLTHDFVESYFLAADALSELSEGELELKELTKRTLARGQAAYLAGRIAGPESLARINIENAWIALREAGLIAGEKKVGLSADRQKIAAYRDEIGKYL